jgi:hypothetical protein
VFIGHGVQTRDFLLLGEDFRGDIVQHGFHWLGWVELVISPSLTTRERK